MQLEMSTQLIYIKDRQLKQSRTKCKQIKVLSANMLYCLILCGKSGEDMTFEFVITPSRPFRINGRLCGQPKGKIVSPNKPIILIN